MIAPVYCCNGDCKQGRTCPRNAPWHSGNGGNTIDHGEALHKPVYTGDDVIEPTTSFYPWGLFAALVLWLIFGLYVAYRAGGLS